MEIKRRRCTAIVELVYITIILIGDLMMGPEVKVSYDKENKIWRIKTEFEGKSIVGFIADELFEQAKAESLAK